MSDIVLLVQLDESLELKANLVRQEAMHTDMAMNPDKTKSLAITIKQPPVPDYNQLSITLSGWDIEQMATVKHFSSAIDHTRGCMKVDACRGCMKGHLCSSSFCLVLVLQQPLGGHCDIRLARKLQLYRTSYTNFTWIWISPHKFKN